MRWSYKLARVAGIDVRVHATFFLLLAFVAFQGYTGTGRAAGALAGVVSILVVFFIVILHEYGHALAARRYGIPTQDITLLPIGGVARLERMPKDPRQELVIALAGPAVNVALAALLWGYLQLAGPGDASAAAMTAPDERFFGQSVARQLLQVNVWLAAFNLIPAFPMDGGRVLRAVLAMRTGNYAAATARAAGIGRAIALVLGFLGLFVLGRPTLVLVALFVWLSAAGEAGAVQESAALSDVGLEQVMITDVRTLAPADPLGRAAELVLAGFQQDFPVVDGGAVVGLLTRQDLVRALAEHGAGAPVAGAMRREFPVARPGERLEDALARLSGAGADAMPVVHGRTLLGVLTRENVGEYLMIRSALLQARRGEPARA